MKTRDKNRTVQRGRTLMYDAYSFDRPWFAHSLALSGDGSILVVTGGIKKQFSFAAVNVDEDSDWTPFNIAFHKHVERRDGDINYYIDSISWRISCTRARAREMSSWPVHVTVFDFPKIIL